jgi:glycosyltransferase involved in cell wall biosynthesis
MRTIPGQYTLFSRIPVYPDQGRVLTDPLWAKDLALHFPYIDHFVLCCPAEPPGKAPDNAVEIPGFTLEQLVALRRDYGHGSILKNLIPNFRGVARALRTSDIVHSGGAGWAFPLSFFILALRPFYRFKWVMVIESSFWKKPSTGRVSPRQWVRHHVHKVLLGACLRRADARIFTTDSYRKFFGIPQKDSLIAPAIWLDEEVVITDAEQQARLAALPTDQVRFVFPARLVHDKGSDIILAAIERAEALLPQEAPDIAVDIIGEGPMAETCRTFAQTHQGRITVRFLEPVPYGAPFFTLLREYHALLLANRQDEQPRVIFDAFAQGVPVISTATDGVREIVNAGTDTLVYEVDDVEALAGLLIRFATEPDLRNHLTQNTVPAARGRSHAAMHKDRLAFFEQTILRETPQSG